MLRFIKVQYVYDAVPFSNSQNLSHLQWINCFNSYKLKICSWIYTRLHDHTFTDWVYSVLPNTTWFFKCLGLFCETFVDKWHKVWTDEICSLPVSICQTYTVPSEQLTTMKSSSGRHLMVCTGNRCLPASIIHFLSLRLSRVTEWSLATEHTQGRILDYISRGKKSKLITFFPKQFLKVGWLKWKN